MEDIFADISLYSISECIEAVSQKMWLDSWLHHHLFIRDMTLGKSLNFLSLSFSSVI